MKQEAMTYEINKGPTIICPECKRVMDKEQADYREKCLFCGQKFIVE